MEFSQQVIEQKTEKEIFEQDVGEQELYEQDVGEQELGEQDTYETKAVEQVVQWPTNPVTESLLQIQEPINLPEILKYLRRFPDHLVTPSSVLLGLQRHGKVGIELNGFDDSYHINLMYRLYKKWCDTNFHQYQKISKHHASYFLNQPTFQMPDMCSRHFQDFISNAQLKSFVFAKFPDIKTSIDATLTYYGTHHRFAIPAIKTITDEDRELLIYSRSTQCWQEFYMPVEFKFYSKDNVFNKFVPNLTFEQYKEAGIFHASQTAYAFNFWMMKYQCSACHCTAISMAYLKQRIGEGFNLPKKLFLPENCSTENDDWAALLDSIYTNLHKTQYRIKSATLIIRDHFLKDGQTIDLEKINRYVATVWNLYKYGTEPETEEFHELLIHYAKPKRRIKSVGETQNNVVTIPRQIQTPSGRGKIPHYEPFRELTMGDVMTVKIAVPKKAMRNGK